MRPIKILAVCAIAGVMLTSCKSDRLITKGVTYQSVRTTFRQAEAIPEGNLEILLCYAFDDEGRLIAVAKNLSDEVMIIDQAKTFFVAPNGTSISYYDPTVHTTTTSSTQSNTGGASVNLGAVAGAFGIGGGLGTLMRGINVGGAQTIGVTNTNTDYISDQQFVNIAPGGQIAMSKEYSVAGLLSNSANFGASELVGLTPKTSPTRFSFCVNYSLDNGVTYKQLKTDFYVNACITIPTSGNEHLNDAVRKIYTLKPDAVNEQCWGMYFNTNIPKSKSSSMYNQGVLYDFQ